MAINHWAEALQIKSKDIAAWQAEAPKSASFIQWCLKSGKVSAEKYFAWAKDEYALPLLESDFFKNPPDRTLWQGIRTVANWSAEMLPVSNWDGIVFVACVEPPKDIQWSFPVRYILAHPQDLELYWEQLQSDDEPLLSAEEPPQTNDAVIEVPEGLNLSLSPASEDEIPTATGAEMPEGLNIDTPPPPVLKLNLSPTAAFPPEPTSPPQQTQSASAPMNADFTEITRIASSLDFLKQDFESSMILVYRNDLLVPLLWDSTWKPTAQPIGPKNLSEPSAFRIVLRTKNAYLGHIVDTPVNREFFNGWGVTELPEKVLIQPIVDKSAQEIVGMFISICNPSLRNQVVLSAGERHSAEILRLMKDSQSAAA